MKIAKTPREGSHGVFAQYPDKMKSFCILEKVSIDCNFFPHIPSNKMKGFYDRIEKTQKTSRYEERKSAGVMDDEKIIALYFQRNEQAITETDEKYGGRLRRFAGRFLVSLQDGEECVSDTYLETWKRVPPTKPDNLFAFLAVICRHRCFDRLDYMQAEKRCTRIADLSVELQEVLPGGERAEDRVETAELAKQISAFLRGLDEEKRHMFLRRYWYGDSIREIADAFDSSESKVKTCLHRVRRDLAKKLEKEGFGHDGI